MTEMAHPGGPLSAVVVLDLTTFLSGPYCTQILADLGARIIKVESLDGESSRKIPPHFVGNDSAYYLASNRSKESIAIDLKKPEGLELILALIDQVDVVVENFRPGVCQRLGLNIDEIRARRPSLIWASISGFGQTGPWRERPAYDMIVQALSGVMSLTGEPGRPSVRLGIPVGDLVAGLFTAIGVASALVDRARTGRGDHLDVAMLDCQLSMLSYQAVYSMVGEISPGPQGSQHDSIPTYRSFTAGDGRELVVTANTERMWQGLCEALGVVDLTEDPRFLDSQSRLVHRDELWPRLESAFLSRSAQEWVEELQARLVPAALIQTVPEALQDARESGREMVVELQRDDGRRVAVVGDPIKFADHHAPEPTYPPGIGEDTAPILHEFLGYDAACVQRLAQASVVRDSSQFG